MRTPTLLVSIDGLRPDGLARARAPILERLIRRGASTMRARSVMPSLTLPCHMSMLRGVDVPRHGITTNDFVPLARPVPSLIDVAAQQGRRCAMFYNWGPLRDLCAPESLECSYFVNGYRSAEGDQRIARATADHMTRDAIDFAFVYLGYTDMAGHDVGWMTEPYFAAIENADRCVGLILDALGSEHITPNVLVQSDHGGHERGHGTDSPEDMTIPWILAGPGVPSGAQVDEEVRIYDTCPTLAALMGLDLAWDWEGRVVSDALPNSSRTPSRSEGSVGTVDSRPGAPLSEQVRE